MTDHTTQRELATAEANLSAARRDRQRLLARVEAQITAAYLRGDAHVVVELERVADDVREVLGWL